MGFNLKLCEYAAYAMYYVHDDTAIDEVAQVIRKYLGRDLLLPGKVPPKPSGRKPITSDPWKKRNKIIAYLGTEECKNCKNTLHKWKEIVKDGEMRHPDLGFVFVAHPDTHKQWVNEFSRADIPHSVVCDYEDSFFKTNKIPEDPGFHACLLDETNTVMFVGSPIKNRKVWDECKKVIAFSNQINDKVEK